MSDYKLKVKKSAIKFWHIYWNCLHYVSYIYSDNPTDIQKNQIKKLIDNMIKDGILCTKCKKHFIDWCNNNDITTFYNNRTDLILYFRNLHNNINIRNKKKIFTSNEVDNIYINFNDKILIEYKLDIKKLFENNNIYQFLDIINTLTRQMLLKEFGVIEFA